MQDVCYFNKDGVVVGLFVFDETRDDYTALLATVLKIQGQRRGAVGHVAFPHTSYAHPNGRSGTVGRPGPGCHTPDGGVTWSCKDTCKHLSPAEIAALPKD